MKRTLTSPLIALTALISAQAAHAQQSCIALDDLNDTILYAMPLAYEATMTACAASYASDGFMTAGGPEFVERFRAKQDAAWPGAYRLMKTFAQERAGKEAGDKASGADIGALLDSLPEESVRPFVDALVVQMIAGEIKSDSCGKIERGVSLLAPLPVDNVAGLMTFIAEMADLKNPQICTATPQTQDTVSETSE